MFGMSEFGVTGEDAVLGGFTVFHKRMIIEFHAEQCVCVDFIVVIHQSICKMAPF